jgi:hypothetical protein
MKQVNPLLSRSAPSSRPRRAAGPRAHQASAARSAKPLREVRVTHVLDVLQIGARARHAPQRLDGARRQTALLIAATEQRPPVGIERRRRRRAHAHRAVALGPACPRASARCARAHDLRPQAAVPRTTSVAACSRTACSSRRQFLEARRRDLDARGRCDRAAAGDAGAGSATRTPVRSARHARMSAVAARTGFIAATSWKRAGSSTRRAARLIVIVPDLERLPQRFEHLAPELRQLVEEQHAAVRERDLARLAVRPPPTRPA